MWRPLMYKITIILKTKIGNITYFKLCSTNMLLWFTNDAKYNSPHYSHSGCIISCFSPIKNDIWWYADAFACYNLITTSILILWQDARTIKSQNHTSEIKRASSKIPYLTTYEITYVVVWHQLNLLNEWKLLSTMLYIFENMQFEWVELR